MKDGKGHTFYSQFNTLDKIHHVVLASDNGKPEGCGAIKKYSADTMEINFLYMEFLGDDIAY
jgi:putative acetyltransferase